MLLLHLSCLATIYFVVGHCQSCSSNQVYLDCGSSCGQNCINVCNGSFPNIICNDVCYEGCGCDSATYWSESMDCCLSKLDCVVYDSICVGLPEITNNYTLDELGSINITAQDIKQLQQDSNPDDYQCGAATGSESVANNMVLTQLLTFVVLCACHLY